MNRLALVALAALTAGGIALTVAPGARAQTANSLPYVKLQPDTPGNPQAGHANLTGTLIAGTVQTSAFQMGNSANPGDVLTADGNGVASWQAPSGGGPWSFNGANIYNTNGGNVGVGTSSPQSRLDIAATGNLAEVLRLSTERPWVFRQIFTGSSAGLQLCSTVGLKNFQVTAAGGTNVATFVADDSYPRVGIGTTTPGAPLEVDTSRDSTPSVLGYNFSSTNGSTGVFGHAGSGSGSTIGVDGETDSATGFPIGVYGTASSATAVTSYGGYFDTASTNGVGVRGFATNSSGTSIGVQGVCNSSNGYAVFAAGRFGASGTKSFVIDHPLDPANKYLLHYSEEGPEPYNVYKGHVTTDTSGYAWIQLPGYFQEINRDPDYQLTVIDGSDDFVLAKVTKPIAGNRFQIRTNKPRVQVCWRVEAVRNDRWVRRYGAPVEVAKEGRERGKYQHPELYGLPEEMGTQYQGLGRAAGGPTDRP